ncbi:MAG: Omp28-related outer membrane protein [Ignavibacteria bacterium]
MNKKIILLFVVLFSVFFIQGTNSEPRRMVLEFCTGTWCGYCPCGDVAAEQILVTYPNTIVIAYHGGSDPWQYFNGNPLRTMLGFAAYPTGIFDRTNHPGNGSSFPYITYNMWTSYASTRYTASPNSVINVIVSSSSYNPGTRSLSVTVNATALQDLTGQYKVVYVLTEDNVVYPQNYYASCGTAGYHNDYVHKWIARTVANDPNGENVNTGTWSTNQMISKSITTTIDSAWIPENCNMNVIIYKDNPSGLYLSEVGQGVTKKVSELVGISQTGTQLPEVYALSQNYPNPFNPTTNIKFTLPKDGNVSLKLYNSMGQVVGTYADGFMKAGSYNAEIDGSDLSSGVYFYSLVTDNFVDTKKMMLVK